MILLSLLLAFSTIVVASGFKCYSCVDGPLGTPDCIWEQTPSTISGLQRKLCGVNENFCMKRLQIDKILPLIFPLDYTIAFGCLKLLGSVQLKFTGKAWTMNIGSNVVTSDANGCASLIPGGQPTLCFCNSELCNGVEKTTTTTTNNGVDRAARSLVMPSVVAFVLWKLFSFNGA